MSTKLKWFLLVGLFLVIGGIALVVGFYYAGFDILGWFTSKYAFIVYFFIGAYLFLVSALLVNDYIRK